MAMKALTALVLVPLLGGCAAIQRNNETEAGSGTRKTESRDIGIITQVEASGIGVIKIEVGPPASFKITADDNLLDNYTTQVVGRKLFIRTRGRMSQQQMAEITITVPALRSIEISGGVSLHARGISSENFDIDLDGITDATLSGDAVKANIKTNGTAKLFASELKIREAKVRLRGASQANLNVSSSLTGSVDDVSRLETTGGATTDVRTSPAARLESR